MRVGDEKDEDEADTVGATTLTKENVIIKENNLVKFDFLGKDSVRWEKEIVLPEQVVRNLKEFISNSESEIFDGVRSENVKLFLNEIVLGLTAKVFRTFHASKAVEDYFKKTDVEKDDSDDYKKYLATMANLQATIVSNHKRTLPKNWVQTLQKNIDHLKLVKERIADKRMESIKIMETRIKKLEEMKQTESRKLKLDDYRNKLKILKSRQMTGKEEEYIRKLELKIETMKKTKYYNLTTSLNSYIDPRIYLKWSKKADFDWKKYYPKKLQRKFSWIEEK
jgi:DNA topoisomerase-1